jgi:hypothetical protein
MNVKVLHINCLVKYDITSVPNVYHLVIDVTNPLININSEEINVNYLRRDQLSDRTVLRRYRSSSRPRRFPCSACRIAGSGGTSSTGGRRLKNKPQNFFKNYYQV